MTNAKETIKVGGDNTEVENSGVDKPGVSSKERKAAEILASGARPLEQEISTDPNNESEVQFLNRLLLITREGGWGNGLTPHIQARVRQLNGVKEPVNPQQKDEKVKA